MEDRPGPSSAAPQPQEPSVLAKADEQFQQGIQAIKDNDLEKAVALFDEVLRVRITHNGELAPECASAYYRYGAALLYQAQEASDVLGAPLGGEGDGEEADEKENEERRPSPAPAAAAAADDKGKAPVAEAEGNEDDEDAGEGGEGSGGAGAAESDLQLAWENLETAKHIWAQQPDKFPLELADVHLLLGDVGCENEDFEGALADYDESLRHLEPHVEDGNRRVAEVQYKRCVALQFLDRPEQALEAVKRATSCLNTRSGQLRAQLASGAEGEERQRAEGELEDVTAVLGDLAAKVEELDDMMEQQISTKHALQSALATMSRLEQQPAAAPGAGRSAAPTAAAAGGPVEQAGFDKPSAGGEAAAAAPGAAPAPVRDLGVVGRGTKRLNLAPVQVNAGAGTAAPAEAPAAKKKRSLEDLMGGGGGETTIGFGAAPPAPAAAAPAAAEPAAAPKAAGAAAGAPAELPAFLRPAAVNAVYGGEEAPAAQ